MEKCHSKKKITTQTNNDRQANHLTCKFVHKQVDVDIKPVSDCLNSSFKCEDRKQSFFKACFQSSFCYEHLVFDGKTLSTGNYKFIVMAVNIHLRFRHTCTGNDTHIVVNVDPVYLR